MPVVFDEISGEVAPERSAESPAPQQGAGEPGPDQAELVRHELRMVRAREQRLIAD
jgi:hypothetical protein